MAIDQLQLECEQLKCVVLNQNAEIAALRQLLRQQSVKDSTNAAPAESSDAAAAMQSRPAARINTSSPAAEQMSHLTQPVPNLTAVEGSTFVPPTIGSVAQPAAASEEEVKMCANRSILPAYPVDLSAVPQASTQLPQPNPYNMILSLTPQELHDIMQDGLMEDDQQVGPLD